MGDPMHFDRQADAYDRARPPYPDALYDALRRAGVLRGGARVLDVGAGSGQATETFARAGASVTAIEPGPALAARLSERLPDVRIIPGTLEEADLPVAAYDAAICATAFHWLDPDLALPRLHAALAPGGLLAVWWNVFGDPAVRTPFRDVVARVTARRPSGPPRPPGPLQVEAWLGNLSGGGLFVPEVTEVFRWSVDLATAQIRDLFGTFTDWTDDEVVEVTTAADDLGGVVTEHYATALYVLRRREGS